jgi:hypothetical protein
MYTLTSEEKSTPVMVYTQSLLIRGDVVTKSHIRVSVWLRTEGAPEYLHMLNPQVIFLNASPARAFTFKEIYWPTSQVIAFHLTPPAKDTMDYDETEKNRIMQPLSILVGTFIMNAALRVSTQVDIGTNITSNTRVTWLSLYDAKVSNPNLPQMGELPVPMLLTRPSQIGFGLQS